MKTHGYLEELQGAVLTCEQEAEMLAVGGFGCMDSMLLMDLRAWGLLPHGSVQLRWCSWTCGLWMGWNRSQGLKESKELWHSLVFQARDALGRTKVATNHKCPFVV